MPKPRYFTDTHISARAIQQLRLRGIDIVRCEEVGLAEALDVELLSYAAEHNRIMISCDDDFMQLHFLWLAEGAAHCGIIYLHPDLHCKHIGEIVRIVEFWHNLADNEEDLYNEFWRGDSAK